MAPEARRHRRTQSPGTAGVRPARLTQTRRSLLAVAALLAVTVLAFVPSAGTFALGPVLAAERRSTTDFAGVQSCTSHALCGSHRVRPRPPLPASGKHIGARLLHAEYVLVMAAAAAAVKLMNPRTWLGPPTFAAQNLSNREWTRQYRILGLDESAKKDKVLEVTEALRKKYADDKDALQCVERARLLIMTRLVTESERIRLERERADQIKQVLRAPSRLFQRYVVSWVPLSMRNMVETPDRKHVLRASGLLGAFALLGLLIPTQAQTWVGLGTTACAGLVYNRGRPEVVKDNRGNAGEVRPIAKKELGATMALMLACLVLGVVTTQMLVLAFMFEFQGVFCVTTCFILWLVGLFFKVHQVFDD